MPSVSITWWTQHDDRVCHICQAIDGYTWPFEGEIPFSLVHPTYGEVWNKTLGSLAHAMHKTSVGFSDCRCHVTAKVELKDLLDKLKQLRDELKEELEGPEPLTDDVKTGSRRGTTFEDIGVDPSKYGF